MGARHLSELDLTEYADGELDPRRLRRVEDHLRGCDLCARLVHHARSVASLAGRLPAASAPPAIRRRAADALATDPALELSCRQAAPLIHQRLDRALSPFGAVLLERHLNLCAPCRAELATLARTADLVRALPGVEAPARVRDAVRAERRRLPQRVPVGLRWRPALAAAAVAIIAALAVTRPSLKPAPHTIAEQPAVVAAGPSSQADAAAQSRVPVRPVISTEQAAPAVLPGAGESGVALPPRETAPEPVRQPPVARPAIAVAKGPTPARVTPESVRPQVAMPVALAALRSVARSASHEWEVQRAMEMAGERFATLNSEAVLARLPVSGIDSPAEEPEGRAATAPGAPRGDAATETQGGQGRGASGPAREGAALSRGPLA